MKKQRLIEVTCHCCKGLGEVIVEAGGDGYPPLWDECTKCKGTGMVTTFEKNKKYFAEVK